MLWIAFFFRQDLRGEEVTSGVRGDSDGQQIGPISPNVFGDFGVDIDQDRQTQIAPIFVAEKELQKLILSLKRSEFPNNF